MERASAVRESSDRVTGHIIGQVCRILTCGWSHYQNVCIVLYLVIGRHTSHIVVYCISVAVAWLVAMPVCHTWELVHTTQVSHCICMFSLVGPLPWRCHSVVRQESRRNISSSSGSVFLNICKNKMLMHCKLNLLTFQCWGWWLN